MIRTFTIKEIEQAFLAEDKRLGKLEETKEGGHPFITCTNCARFIKEKFAPKGKIMGYFTEDNPTALIGQDAGGHDFLLTDDGYIIDMWPKHIEQMKNIPVYVDTKERPDLVAKYYGDKTKWKEVKK